MNTEEANKLCVCRGIDDGRPMVHCANCDDWFHFKCVDLDEATAEELDTFFCQPCSTKTNQSTTYKWQLTDDELLMAPKPVEVKQLSRPRTKTRSSISVAPVPSSQTPMPSAPPTFAVDSDSDVGMKDDDGEYTGERQLTRLRRGKQVKRAESDSDRSPSPDSKSRKRKAPAAPPVNTKRKRTLLAKSPSPLSDPVRKYCFGKLQEVIEPIFVEYKTLEDGTERSEEEAKSAASTFNRDLENAVFEHYSEPDKKGNRAALAKYKERFRMLTYNLGQSDRVLLRKGIANGHISAQELSEMSSADLANEQAKQEMEKAAQEALHQSILKTQTILPRAKMTHKGEEIIETNASEDMRVRDEEERERLRAGLRVRTGSILEANPESAGLSSATGISGVTFENHLAEDGTVLSPEKVSPDTPLVINTTTVPLSPITYTKEPGSALPDILSPTEITATPLRGNMHESRPSFDLNALWTGDAPNQSSTFAVSLSSPVGDDEEDVAMDLDDEAGPETDFGMFLDGVEEKKVQVDHATRSTTPPPPAREDKKMDNIPVVWSGDLVMPLDPKPALINKVSVRQVGGRSFGTSPSVWNLLFKGSQALIEGRVPTDRSIKYLVTTRLNPSKELIVVHFAPTEESKENMAELFDFLTKKDRHGLVFPWGTNPPSTAPGKDLYLLPIQASKPLPEFIDLLDHVLIPKQRDENMLLGVFVLSKGKIVVPPIATTPPSEQAAKQPTPPTASSSQQSQQQTPLAPSNSMASLLSTLGTTSSMPYAVTPTPPVAALLPGMQHPPQLPVGVPSNSIPGPYQFSHSPAPPGGPPGQPSLPSSAPIPTGNALLELASSIQNLSPDQLNLILQGLMAGGAGQSPTPPTPVPPPTGPSPWPPATAYGGPQQTPPYQGGMAPGYDRYPNASRSPQAQSGRPRDGPREDHYGRERRSSHTDRGPGPRDSYRGRGGGQRGGRSASDYADGGWNRRRAAAPYTDQ